MARRSGTRRTAAAAVTTRLLTPALWPQLEALFGANGACQGCWCMFWRLEPGEQFSDVKGAEAKKRFALLVKQRAVQGVLAFDGDEAVGWLTFGKRQSFSRLDRAPSLQCGDAERVWSLPCFFIKPGRRGEGIATALLERAQRELQRRGAEVAEAYPVKAPEAGERLTAAAAYTGTVPLFRRAGFSFAQRRPKGRQRMRWSPST